MDILMRVASCEDTLRGKILAYQDPERRASKRQKDLLDIMRLVEAIRNLKNCRLPVASSWFNLSSWLGSLTGIFSCSPWFFTA